MTTIGGESAGGEEGGASGEAAASEPPKKPPQDLKRPGTPGRTATEGAKQQVCHDDAGDHDEQEDDEVCGQLVLSKKIFFTGFFGGKFFLSTWMIDKVCSWKQRAKI